MKRLLVTADTLESNPYRKQMEAEGVEVLHLPLEQFDFAPDLEMQTHLFETLNEFRYVLHGGVRNTDHFLKWIQREKWDESISSLVHLTHRQEVAAQLEEAGIPAICPQGATRPIDLIEFLLRVSGSGAVIYPVAEGETEEIPGLLEEVGIDCVEMIVSKPRSLSAGELSTFRQMLERDPPDAILFHSRGSIIRTWTAFPMLKHSDAICIAASQGAAWKLAKEGGKADVQASGSWESVVEQVLKLR